MGDQSGYAAWKMLMVNSWLVRRYQSDGQQSELGEAQSQTHCCRTLFLAPCRPKQTCPGAASPVK